MLSDEGNTYMRLTYDMNEQDLYEGKRHAIIASALSLFNVEDRDGELVIRVRDGLYGDALFSFVQAILKIADVSYLSRERVQSAYPKPSPTTAAADIRLDKTPSCPS